MQKKIIALVDCDSFFCACERVFNPKILYRPVVVLSNNDGCVVSRTKEAKALGIPMGAPYFKIRYAYEKQGGVAFSSNFTLYGDLSHRVMSILAEHTPDLEIYSIDEAFLDLTNIPTNDLEKLCIKIRNIILKEVGIPVSIGVGPTKVLAKIATTFAKKAPYGVFVMPTNREEKNKLLKQFPVGEIWGIGRASEHKLKIFNIKTAHDLMMAEEKNIQSLLTIVGRRIQDELKEIPSIEIELEREKRKQIIVSRSFDHGLFELDDIKKRLADHVFRASEKLREESLVCFNMSVFVMTNRFKDLPQYYNSYQVNNSTGVDSPVVLIKKAMEALEKIFKYGYEYKKCGVMLNDLVMSDQKQLSFLEPENPQIEKVTNTIDLINQRFGSHTIKVLSCTTKNGAYKDQALKSDRFTTSWKELKLIKI